MSEGTRCPKCGYSRKKEEAVPEWQCPSCQVVYAKAQPVPAFVEGDVVLQQTAGLLSGDSLIQEMRDKQNLAFGIAASVVAAFIGAVLWAVITAITNYQIGWMAVGVGVLVGYANRIAGKGVDTSFGIAGAVISLLGCVAGNFLTVVIIVSRQESIPIIEIMSRINPDIFVTLMKETFQPMDILFYGLAVFEGYKFSIVRVEK